MKFRNNLPSVEEVKNTDIVDYLSSLGFKSSRVSRNDYCCISPFRDERTVSLKVNRSMNRWYDFGDGKVGKVVDLGILFHHCSVVDCFKKIKSSLSFRQQKVQALNKEVDGKKIKIIRRFQEDKMK